MSGRRYSAIPSSYRTRGGREATDHRSIDFIVLLWKKITIIPFILGTTVMPFSLKHVHVSFAIIDDFR